MNYVLAIIFAISHMPAPSANQPILADLFVAQPDTCYYWEHWKYLGKRGQLRAFRQRTYLGTDFFNDKISSIRCTSGCYLVGFEHANYQGESKHFFDRSPEIGGWNDRISSMQVFCPD
jgi:Beta/Gamma crystallin